MIRRGFYTCFTRVLYGTAFVSIMFTAVCVYYMRRVNTERLPKMRMRRRVIRRVYNMLG